MSKQPKGVFACQACGYQSPKWLGRCPECGSWNTLTEETLSPPSPLRRSGPEPIPLMEVPLGPGLRWRTGIGEFDRILGGGLVPGSLILLGGEPGIGKSTLVLQLLERLALEGRRCLYLSGEESPQQIRLRAQRLGMDAPGLHVLCATCLEEILERLPSFQPDILAADSIQTLYTDALGSSPGTVGQIREVASRLMILAKQSAMPVILVGHVTKEGTLAGPKLLEHLVDTVLYFEGDEGHLYRILRAAKNRFGATHEIGVFEMSDRGLLEVANPSRLFLEERPRAVSGSVVIPCMEGSRPLLVEIQALVSPTPFGMPRRTAVGVDAQRISLLVAVLTKRLGMGLAEQDIFVNVAGGLRVAEPAADLGVVTAVISSFLDRPVDPSLVAFGEVGLAGEIRAVGRAEMRLKEAQKMGFSRCLVPRRNAQRCPKVGSMELLALDSVQDLFDQVFG